MTLRAYLKTNRPLLFVGVLTLIGGVWLNLRSFRQFPNMTLTGYLINLLPGLLLLLSWILAARFHKWRWLLIGLGLLVALLASGVALILHSVGEYLMAVTTPEQDVGKYEEILASYPEAWVAHFPRQVPENATRVRFYYLPAFLQGGSSLQLHCRLPESEVDFLLEQYQPVAKKTENGLGEIITAVDKQIDFPSTRFHSQENSESGHLPADFLVLTLGGEPFEAEDWNHGHIYGIAISTLRQEVTFWAEYW